MEIIPIVIGLTEMVKKTGRIPSQYLQIVAIAIGIVLFLLAYLAPDFYGEFVALVAAIASPGMYSAGKRITGADKIQGSVTTGHPVVSPLEPRT